MPVFPRATRSHCCLAISGPWVIVRESGFRRRKLIRLYGVPSYMVQSVLVVLLVVAVLWLALLLLGGSAPRSRRISRPEGQDETDAEAGNGHRFPAVSIRTFRQGCPAAEAIKGKRFLPEEAPPLPLPECTWARCNCRYAHHVDRRTGNVDRRRMVGENREYPLSVGDSDPRGGRGRRARDSESSTS